MKEYQQPVACSSNAGKTTRFRFSPVAKVFLKDYFENTNQSPQKREREQILARIKELGQTGATDKSIYAWFVYNRRKGRQHRSILFLTSTSDPNEPKWVDAHHETLWPSLTRETLKDLQDLYTELFADDPNAKIPCEPWAKILDAKPVHVRMWCKAQERQRKFRPDATPTSGSPPQVAEERSQLPTPGNSISPEPPITSLAQSPPSPDTVKDEPPVSPVVDTTPFQPPPEVAKGNTSMGLHEAIQSAFSAPVDLPQPTPQTLKPLSTTGPDRQRNLLPRNSHETLQVVSPLTPPLTSVASDAPPAFTFPPLASITSPLQSEPSPSSPHCETSGPSKRPDRDLAHERATLVASVSEKLKELNGMFDSAHGLVQFAGSIQNISRRNEQFLKDVSAGRFAHLGLTDTHPPDRQETRPMPEYNPLRVLAERRDGKMKGKERDGEVGMEVD